MATIPQYVPATAIDAVDLDPSVYVDPRTGKALPILVTGTPPADPLATAALQTAGNTSLAGILTALGTLNAQDALEATAANQTLILNSLASTNTSLATLNSDFAPLATSALQTTGNTSLASLVTLLTPAITAPAFARTSASGATTAGQLYSLTIYNSGTTNGTVGGQTLYPGEWVAFNAPLGDTLAAVSYVPGTEFTITTVGLAAPTGQWSNI